MLAVLRNLLDDNARDIKKLSRTVQQINDLEPEMQRLRDEELAARTGEFRQRLANGAGLDDLLPEAFAVVRETSRRVLGQRPFDVQLMGGIVLHQGKIAEMKTGEGKTLVATMPVYLNALAGKGVHVVTVNDYLARRDSEWMGRIYRFLGLSVGLIVHGLDYAQRRQSYACDVAYGTNNEFGFDYLRDNMALEASQLVQRELHYAIVDEVDSILIDEARTPLIISGQAEKPTDLYYRVAKIIPRLVRETDYTVDEKARVVALTEAGVARVERLLGVDNLYDDVNMELSHQVNQALKAHVLMKRDRDYVVKDGQVIIVDEFTGRLMFGRRYSEGLHQAIEAKEGVKIQRESQTLATITFQNFFRMYGKLAGMTGTAATEAEEFRKIYGLDVVVIPTNMPMIRTDHSDRIYRTEAGKFRAVVEEIKECYQQKRPVLVGTISIEKSEKLSGMLKREGIPHQVLNAKYHEQEAQIIAQAGRLGAVTIATNMAGRGTDIMLGGNPEALAREELRRQGVEPQGVDSDTWQQLLDKYQAQTEAEHEQVVATGGLHIIGTERHESRRIDNQLRGRSGRQGDPGSSRFYVSLEDDLMRLFGADSLGGILDRLGMDDSTPIDHSLVSRALENAQKKIEARNFDTRKRVLEYDDVMNQHREVIYRQRMEVLREHDLRGQILGMLDTVVDRTVERYSGESRFPEEWDLNSLLDYAEQSFLPGHGLVPGQLAGLEKEEVRQLFQARAREIYQAREDELEAELMRQLERLVVLKVVDAKWMDHLDAMDDLRQGIGLRAYGQRDPLIEYKYEAFQMFNDMIEAIQEDVVRYILRVRLAQQPQPVRPRQVTENRGQAEQASRPVKRETKVGRNDPCPCGSGKKYKKCCGQNQIA
ncbi:MAG: preprotein translocase subunit SecA [Clostridia bacterium]|nr:MAG: preprotein translocase subunit SecA [Clostridia bacterium]